MIKNIDKFGLSITTNGVDVSVKKQKECQPSPPQDRNSKKTSQKREEKKK